MSINHNLFEGERIRLAPPDPDQDAEVEAAWTHDAAFLRLLDTAPARPLSPWQVKKKYEAIEKEEGKHFYFIVRRRDDGRAVGFVRLFWVDLMHGAAMLQFGIGRPEDRGQGLGSEVLRLILNYAFAELGLHRVGAHVPEYNAGAARLLRRFGFVEEVRRRQAIQRDGRRWDVVGLGLLQREWQAARAGAEAARPASANGSAPAAEPQPAAGTPGETGS